MTEPTDNELEALAIEHEAFGFGRADKQGLSTHGFDPDGLRAFARAVLARWGTPPVVAGEPDYATFALWYADHIGDENKPVRDAALATYEAFAPPQPTQAQAGAVPLDEARRLFNAGWKAAALFCDREDVVADGIIGFGACQQFEAAFAAAHGIKGGQHGAE